MGDWLEGRPVMVGEAPSADGDPARPCTGESFRRLARVAGGAETRFEVLRFLASFERRNVLDVSPGRQEDGKGHLFPLDDARAAAAEMELEGRVVLICGKRAARAFGLTDADYFERREDGPGRVAYVIPHPSGINRWWNAEENRARARRFFSRMLDDGGRGGEGEVGDRERQGERRRGRDE